MTMRHAVDAGRELSDVRATEARLVRAALDRANDSVMYVRLSGRRSVITRFEAALIGLASGQTKGRRAKTAFVDLVLGAARRMLEIDRADALTGRALREAFENGSEEQIEAEQDRFLKALPQLHELSEAELMREYERVQRDDFFD